MCHEETRDQTRFSLDDLNLYRLYVIAIFMRIVLETRGFHLVTRYETGVKQTGLVVGLVG